MCTIALHPSVHACSVTWGAHKCERLGGCKASATNHARAVCVVLYLDVYRLPYLVLAPPSLLLHTEGLGQTEDIFCVFSTPRTPYSPLVDLCFFAFWFGNPRSIGHAPQPGQPYLLSYRLSEKSQTPSQHISKGLLKKVRGIVATLRRDQNQSDSRRSAIVKHAAARGHNQYLSGHRNPNPSLRQPEDAANTNRTIAKNPPNIQVFRLPAIMVRTSRTGLLGARLLEELPAVGCYLRVGSTKDSPHP